MAREVVGIVRAADRGRDRARPQAMKAPACIIAGNDVIHSPITARKAASLIPGAVLHENVVEKLPDDGLRPEWDRKEWRDAEPRIAEIFSDFLVQTERAPRVA